MDNKAELIAFARTAHIGYAAVLNRIEAFRQKELFLELKTRNSLMSQNYNFSKGLLKEISDELLSADKTYLKCAEWINGEICQLRIDCNEFDISESIEKFRIHLKQDLENAEIYKILLESIQYIGL
jgi:hypothetical protein